jgi:tetratricopeptide (TPR) repeat protein
LQLEKFKDWRLSDKTGSTPASTFWINGFPGVGKSTISAYVCDLLVQQYPENPILYFFCKNGAPRLNTAHDIVRTMAYQLSETYPTYRRYLQTIQPIPRYQSSEKVIYLFEELIKKPLLQELRDSDIFIVLDGLDELETTSSSTHDAIYNRKLDIEVLLEHLVLLPRIKILVTSRSAPELMKILGESGATHTITRGDNAQDITTYSETRVTKSPRLSRGFQEIEKDPIKYFADKSNGIFLWAAIVLDILERAVTIKEFSEALENPPSALNNLYDQVFTRAKASGNYGWIKEILNWTLVAQKPFTTEQMKKAVELSTGDKLFEIETLLRSECGSLLELIPVLGTEHGKEYEVHIGHETLQVYLTGTGSNDVLFSKIEGHGKAALGCLRYLLGAESSEDCFHLYATEQWRWHMRKSMGRDSDEQRWGSEIEFVDSGDSLPPELARSILICLYQLFTTEKVDLWLEHEGRKGYNCSFYEVVRDTCEFVGDWYSSNIAAFEDPSDFSGSDCVDNLGTFNTWRLGIPSSESIGSALWPRCCHIWLWNTWPRWWDVFWAYESLMKLDVWTHHSTAPDSTLTGMMETEKNIRSEAIAKGYKQNQKIIGRINVRNANVGRHFEKKGSHNTFMNIFTAGGADELSGACQSNLAVGCYYTGSYCRGLIADTALEGGIVRIQDALDENPYDFPRNYETLGRLYESQSQEKYYLAVEAYQRGIEIDPEHLTGCRNQYYLLKRTQLIERENPDYDATIELLEEAIKEDPENAMSNYMHLLADLYKKKGDLDGTRKSLRASIAFNPSCSYNKWDNLADTYIANINNFEDASNLDRRNWCDVFAEAAVQDPSHAFSYWDRWVSKAESLEHIHHFQAAIDMLEYGIQKTSEIESLSSKAARPKFELSLGNTLCSKAEWTSAVAVLEDALKHEKESNARDSIYMSTGRAYLSCERYNEAEQAFLKLLDLSYNFPDGRAHLAEVYLLSGRYPQALKEYKTVIQQESQAFKTWKEDENYHYREYRDLSEGRAWLNLGCVYDRMKRPERAVDCFKRAIALFEFAVEEIITPPDREEIWRWHGRVLASLAWLYERVDGDSERAEKTYAWAVKRFESTVWKEDDELQNSDWREAEQAWERVKRGEKWMFPGEEADVERRKRYRALKFRSDWCVHVGKRDSRMMRGHG